MNDDFQMNENSIETMVSESFESQAQVSTAQTAIENVSHDAVAHDNIDTAEQVADQTQPDESQEEFAADTAMAVTPAEPEVPTGPSDFEIMGLSPSLVQATKDMGFTKATAVQLKTIPLALQTGGDKKFVDLMVSSQTGRAKPPPSCCLYCTR